MTTQGLGAPVRGRAIPKVCACCDALFFAGHISSRYCSLNCKQTAYYRRRKERDQGQLAAVQPLVLQPQILDDADDLPAAWRESAPSPLAPFAYRGRQVRVVADADGCPWFVAADVCTVLGLVNPRKALERLDSDERGVSSIHTPGGHQSMTTVNESGLYSLILGSRKPEARAFKRWVTHEVLPSIRRTGSYSMPAATTQPKPLPEGIHVVAATQRRAAELWWEAIESEVHGALARRLNPRHRTDAGLPLVVGYQWQQLTLIGR